MKQYKQFSTVREDHVSGSQRTAVMAAVSGISSSIVTVNSNAGLNGESRLGFYEYDLQD